MLGTVLYYNDSRCGKSFTHIQMQHVSVSAAVGLEPTLFTANTLHSNYDFIGYLIIIYSD